MLNKFEDNFERNKYKNKIKQKSDCLNDQLSAFLSPRTVFLSAVVQQPNPTISRSCTI